VHIRPLEIFLAEKVYDIQTKKLYQEFLFVQMGKSVTSDQFSKALSEAMEEHCNIESLGIAAWRHIAIALKREFIPPSADPFDDHQDVGDTAAGHTTRIARSTYAVQATNLPGLSSDAMLEHEAFCKSWHAVLHFGDQPHPKPLRQLRKAMAQNLPIIPTHQTAISQEHFDSTMGEIMTVLKAMKQENAEMRQENAEMKQENAERKQENAEMKTVIGELVQEVRCLRAQNSENNGSNSSPELESEYE
jgi:hypothetical protein